MLIVCPNCASSYGVDMASLRPAGGLARKVRCARCRWVWQAELSYTEKLMVAADAVLPVRRAMLAAAQAAADAARSSLPRLRRPTTILAEELAAAGAPADPVSTTGLQVAPANGKPVRAASSRLTGRIAGTVTKVASGLGHHVRRPSWALSWPASWRLSSLRGGRRSPSRLHWLVVGLALADAAVIAGRLDVVWVMPQTAPFYAALGMPVSLRGVQFDRLTAAAEQRDGESVLTVKGQIGNSTDKPETVPHLRFAILNAQRQEIYSWTAVPGQGRRLPAGETLGFESKLVLPPPDTRAVTVRFVDPDNSF